MQSITSICVFAFLAVFSMIEALGNRNPSVISIQDPPFPTFSQKLLYNDALQNKNSTLFYQQESLPKDVLPERYHLWMKPNTDGSTDFSGKVTIELKCVKATKHIILHSKGLNITKFSLQKLGSSQPDHDLQMKTNPKYEQILFEPKPSLVSGEKYKLLITFRGQMKDADIKKNTQLKNGFFRRSYIKKDGTRKTYVYTILGSDSARAAFPCFNDPGFKSVFLVTIEHDKNLKAVTNTPLVKQVPRSNGMVESVFEPSVKMSSYHVAFAISDFATISTRTKRGTKIIFWAREDVISDMQSSFGIASTSVSAMEEYTGLNYPYKELNVFGTQQVDYAFEAFGLIVIWDRIAVWKNTKDDNKLHEFSRRISLPHEISHMWFGGLFTVKGWEELWLYQGLPNFFLYHILEKYDKAFRRETLIPKENHKLALPVDSTPSLSIAMNPKRRNTSDETYAFYFFYAKPAALFYMLENLLNKDVFQQGIRKYLHTYKFKNANAADLWDVFQSLKPSFDVKTFMHDWEYQSGYPVINIKYVGKDTNGNKVYTATQSRYVDGLTPDDPKYQAKYSNYSWYVPFWYTDSSSPTDTHLVWMNKTSVNITVPGCAKWIKGNAGQVGYYRVMYEQDMWDNLASQLDIHYKAFSASDRSSLSSDAFEFWEDSKDFNITILLKITSYLKEEQSTSPLRTIMGYLDTIVKKIRFQPHVFELFKNYLSFLLKESLKKNDFKGVWKNPFQRITFAELFDILAYVGEPEAINKGLDLVNHWIKTGKYNNKYIYVRQSAYEMAARYGNRTHWEFLYNQYRKIVNVNGTIDVDDDQSRERTRLLAGLSATKSTYYINRWLNDSYLESVANKTDIWEKLEQVSRFNPGRDLAWNYFQTNFQEILERDARVNGNTTTSFLDFTKYFDEESNLQEVEQFARSQPKLWTIKATNTSLKAIRDNIKWLKRNEQQIEDFLTQQAV